MGVVRFLHVFGAAFLVGGATALLLLRPLAGRAEQAGRQALYQLAGQVQMLMIALGSGLLLVTGVVLWVGMHIKFLTGWLLLGVVLYLAASALDGAFLSPNLRRLRAAARTGSVPEAADAGAVTIQVINWVLLVVVVFLMTAQPF